MLRSSQTTGANPRCHSTKTCRDMSEAAGGGVWGSLGRVGARDPLQLRMGREPRSAQGATAETWWLQISAGARQAEQVQKNSLSYQ